MSERARPAIDLNADLAEGFGRYALEGDIAVMPLVDSANIACGFHAGDPRTIDAAVSAAKRHGVRVGAHPGFPDLVGFGRRMMALGTHEITTDLVYQIGAVDAFCRRHGVRLRHVKPHGALGNLAWQDPSVADAVVAAVASVDPELAVLAISGSALESRARAAGLPVAREAYLDRAYRADGTLVPRAEPGAVLHDEHAIVERALELVRHGTVRAVDGTVLDVGPDTLCLHGDTDMAAPLLSAVRTALESEGVALRAFGDPADLPRTAHPAPRSTRR
ncbi:lactam utilization protein LamB [Spongiactinospora gelatinilytica]|uniref:5-oxoprolinase subunit A n=1 Tax=Spongiactinospora gelatinilytica TaxID=2666298 RepID=A0A2W2H1Z5_9ACTN|nr:5-oxoprolinase subunit PxpA [Spongiactinospora gelatinilytica]PZG56076.1 lactam utilization protein LamB [Spongiactinospora gelatinilytica]